MNEDIQIITDFVEILIDNSKDIDPEFVNIVNDNFWNLI